MSSPSGPTGPGSVVQAPHLPPGFTETFSSRFVDTPGLRQHAVIGGDGPPLLLVHGWPQTWYAWRMIMPGLARRFRVIAVDQRGVGLSGKPRDGYDTATLAGDLAALMDTLGHPRFAVYGTDTGLPIAYALAADHRGRVERLAVSEAPLPGLSPPPPPNRRYWHVAFNRLPDLNEQLVSGREGIFLRAAFDTAAGKRKLPDDTVRYYADMIADDQDALRGTFEIFRAFDISAVQNEERQTRRLTMPVLAIGGAESYGEGVGNTMKLVADDVRTAVLPDCGHWVAEQAPEELLATLTSFLAPYRDLVGTAATTSAWRVS
jgi:pimeloyl-ACP methyl ester carboxylesterase